MTLETGVTIIDFIPLTLAHLFYNVEDDMLGGCFPQNFLISFHIFHIEAAASATSGKNMTSQTTENMTQIPRFWFSKGETKAKEKRSGETPDSGWGSSLAPEEKETLWTRWKETRKLGTAELLKTVHVP